ncbi:MAG: hypothetical protein LBS53_05045 [Synergistaceae bacterium]|jgi:N-acetylglucosamine kinase-like BadF-type ATPase|nr:hypothetical protein [Synergistaceae bacterium]
MMIDRGDQFFLGVDGGGTKTDAVLTGSDGVVLAKAKAGGLSYRHNSMESVLEILSGLLETCSSLASIGTDMVTSICIGLPLYGEYESFDAVVSEKIAKRLGDRVIIVNDAEVAWAGSLSCRPGINVVAGTGMIAFGRDEKGNVGRAGGWSEHFSDEGSGYWLAVRGMGIFSKQSDGRLPRGPLYRLVKEKYNLCSDYDFIRVVEEKLLPNREKTAAFQFLIAEAAKMGDMTIPPLYEKAAEELSCAVVALKEKLDFFMDPIIASYSGGVFNVGEMILDPLKVNLSRYGIRLEAPIFTPAEGAAMMASCRLRERNGNERGI